MVDAVQVTAIDIPRTIRQQIELMAIPAIRNAPQGNSPNTYRVWASTAPQDNQQYPRVRVMDIDGGDFENLEATLDGGVEQIQISIDGPNRATVNDVAAKIVMAMRVMRDSTWFYTASQNDKPVRTAPTAPHGKIEVAKVLRTGTISNTTTGNGSEAIHTISLTFEVHWNSSGGNE